MEAQMIDERPPFRLDDVSAACGWDGWIGCEYRPSRGVVSGGTSAGLGWLRISVT